MQILLGLLLFSCASASAEKSNASEVEDYGTPDEVCLTANRLTHGGVSLSLPTGWSFQAPLQTEWGDIILRFENDGGSNGELEKVEIAGREAYVTSASQEDFQLEFRIAVLDDGVNAYMVELMARKNGLESRLQAVYRIFRSFDPADSLTVAIIEGFSGVHVSFGRVDLASQYR